MHLPVTRICTFRGAIDYIFLRDGAGEGPSLRASAALEMIGEAEAAAEGGGLPSSRHPSDHLPLATDIVLTPAAATRGARPPALPAAQPEREPAALADAMEQDEQAAAAAAGGLSAEPSHTGARTAKRKGGRGRPRT